MLLFVWGVEVVTFTTSKSKRVVVHILRTPDEISDLLLDLKNWCGAGEGVGWVSVTPQHLISAVFLPWRDRVHLQYITCIYACVTLYIHNADTYSSVALLHFQNTGKDYSICFLRENKISSGLFLDSISRFNSHLQPHKKKCVCVWAYQNTMQSS